MPGLQPGRALSQGSWAQALPTRAQGLRLLFQTTSGIQPHPKWGLPLGFRIQSPHFNIPKLVLLDPGPLNLGCYRASIIQIPSEAWTPQSSALSPIVWVARPSPLPKSGP